MKIQQQYPEKQYPYLSIMTFGDPITTYENDDIVIVSMAEENLNEDKKPYVQYLNGNKPGWFTKTERDYAPLPANFKITIIQ